MSKLIEKGQGQLFKVLIWAGTPGAAAFLQGQTSHSLNVTNNLVEVESFKKEIVADDTAVTYTERSDGKRDVAIPVTIGQPALDADRVVQMELFNKIVGSTSTTTTVYHGKVYEETVGEITTKYFEGYKCIMKIASFNRDFPDGADITGSIDFQGAGVKPEEIEKIAVESLTE